MQSCTRSYGGSNHPSDVVPSCYSDMKSISCSGCKYQCFLVLNVLSFNVPVDIVRLVQLTKPMSSFVTNLSYDKPCHGHEVIFFFERQLPKW